MTHGNNQRRGGAGRRVYSHRFSGFKWQRTGTEGICRDPAKRSWLPRRLWPTNPMHLPGSLRTSEVEKPTIAFYWPMDLRINYLAAILTGLRTEIEKLQFDCELIICTYRNDHLAEEQGLKNAYRYSAAIIGAPSEADMAYLQGLKNQSAYHPLQSIFGEIPHRLLTRRKHLAQCGQSFSSKKAMCAPACSILMRSTRYQATAFYAPSIRRRDGAFYRKEFHIFRRRQLRWRGNRRPRYLSLDHPPKAILSMSDTIAIGASSILSRKGLVMPEDVELIAFAIGDPNLSHFANPSLSVIEMPSHEMAEKLYRYRQTGHPDTRFTPLP